MYALEHYRFALISHSAKLCDCVRRYLSAQDDITVRYRIVDIGCEAAVAKDLLDDGIEAIFCHGGTAQTLLREIGNSLSIIDRTDMDIISGLILAKAVTNHVALSTDYRDVCNTRLMEELLGVRIHHIQYANWDELMHGVAQAYDSGVSLVIGGGLSCQCMEQRGGRGIVLEPSGPSILRALDQARAIARHKRLDAQRQADFLAILKQLDDGVICVDQSGDMVFCNPTAQRLLKLPPGKALSGFTEQLAPFFLEQVIQDGAPRVNVLVTVSNEKFMASTLALPLYGGKRGAVVLFRDITSLQNIDRKIRSELYSRGFIARHTSADIKGQSPAMRTLVEKIACYATANASVHVSGETGTGKELVAHALHAESDRKGQPFVAVNCSALPESLLESELFGYEEGAFTGAKRGGKAGLFEMANQGTLFLDEIGDINHSTQLRLLRVLEAKEVMRVGGARVLPVDVRIISASHKPLAELVQAGRFRADLYFRLVVLQLALAPLRQRPDDIPALLEGLLARYGKDAQTLTPAMLERMRRYAWPGNVRELLSLVESYLILLGVRPADEGLFASLFEERSAANASRLLPQTQAVGGMALAGSMKEHLDSIRLSLAQDALRANNGDRQAAARQLGVSYNSLWRILRGI